MVIQNGRQDRMQNMTIKIGKAFCGPQPCILDPAAGFEYLVEEFTFQRRAYQSRGCYGLGSQDDSFVYG
jgi:hypothetical protein